MTESRSDSITFASLGLKPEVMEGIRQAGFVTCTPIQAQTLPIALAGRDVAGQAQTGTGKTAAFLVALYQALLTRPAPASRSPTSIRALVVAPTRELAVQIHRDALVLGAHTGFTHALVFDGIDYDKQRQQLSAGCDVLIGTPGRLIDYFKQHVFDLKSVQVLVLDEADRMFDLGFIADIRYIMRRLPPPGRRQSMLFSATLSHRVLELAYEHMNNPELVRIEPDKMTVDQVRQLMYYPSMEEKVPLLIGLLHQSEAVRTMVFVNTKRMAERLEAILRANGFQAQALSGDVPQDAPDYVHRIGRTARAGAEGDAISFACEDTAVSLPDIESYIGHKIPFAPISPELLATGLVSAPHAHRPHPGGGRRHGGGGGRRERRGSRPEGRHAHRGRGR